MAATFIALPRVRSGNQFRLLTLADSNSDTVWDYSQGSSVIVSLNVNFDRGTLVTNAERSHIEDSMWADFKDLRFQVAGSTTWPVFTDLDPYADDDDFYDCRMYSQTRQKVEKFPQTCIGPV